MSAVPETQKNRIIWFANLGHSLDHYIMLIYPTTILAMEKAFPEVSYGTLLQLSLGSFVLIGIGSLPSGWLGDRWSRRGMMIIFFFGSGLACLATAATNSFFTLAVGLGAIGLVASIYHPVGAPMMVASAAPGRLGRVIGLNGVFGNLAIAAAPFVTGAVTDLAGWRMAFILPGIAALGLGVAFMRMVPAAAERATRKSPHGGSHSRFTVFRVFGILFFCTFAAGLIFNVASVTFPKFFEERLPDLVHSATAAGAVTTAVTIVGALAQFTVGRCMDRFSLGTVFLVTAGLQMIGLFFLINAFGIAAPCAAMVAMLGQFGQVTVNEAMTAKYAPDRLRGRIYAVRYFLNFAVAAFAVTMAAKMHDATGEFVGAYRILAICGALIFVGALFFPRRDVEPIAARPAVQPAG
ncbi:Predicted arabinose efflux permease, MFS family [Rhizobiales bacterium GAS113]|nr:Predicted arabinose efflux permease, MFS family [Rhizobiales bacterium GAS113]